MKFYSVGVAPSPQSAIKPENYYSMTGEDFIRDVLPTITEPIVGAYLDNFDWTWDPRNLNRQPPTDPARVQFEEYASRGVVLNNINSSVAHYRQTVGLASRMVYGAIMVFDDTWFDTRNECFIGKGAAGVYHLLSEGCQLTGPIPHHYISKGIRRDYGNLPNYIALRKGV